MNCGDWVESCTALVEHEDGRFEIITWTQVSATDAVEAELEDDLEEQRDIAAIVSA